MKITVTGNGIDTDDNLVYFELLAENDHFKGFAEFYAHANVFKDYCKAIKSFPFESKESVAFTVDNAWIQISLADSAGRINITCKLGKSSSDNVSFTDGSVEANSLHVFADQLLLVDFNKPTSFGWQS